jgi:hypothetical protein
MLQTRRTILRMAAILAAVLSGSGVVEFFHRQQREQVVNKVAGFYTHKEDAVIIGIEYLKSVPKEADSSTLIDLIVPCDSDRYRRISEADSKEVNAIIVEWQREDFEQGRIVNVSGWLLSETEARVCGLTALNITSVPPNILPRRRHFESVL